jgi:hypothetical protein
MIGRASAKGTVIAMILAGCFVPSAVHGQWQTEWQTDLELRVGYGKVCGLCTKGSGHWSEFTSVQLWADRLRQYSLGEWRLLAGPYVKGTYFDEAALVESGLNVGAGRGPGELHVHAGASYATEDIGSNPAFNLKGQERLTAGLGVRGIWFMNEKVYLSLNYDHNSGGPSGRNPGIEQLLVGVGYRW